MHIVMLSDLEILGGAAIAASRLADALCQAGHRVTRLVNAADGQEHAWDTLQLCSHNSLSLTSRVTRRLYRALGENWVGHIVQKELSRALSRLRPDVINVHNLHVATSAGWSAGLLRICADHAPVVWTLHDMWSFTGRCAYNYDCRKFVTGCDKMCPTPTEYPVLAPQQIGRAWQQRYQLLEAFPHMVAVTPSRWLAREAQAGLWRGHRVEVIPYSLPLDVYLPLDRTLARKALGIDKPGPVLLISAQNLTERRKGGGLLVEALRYVSRRPLTLVTLGSGRLRFEAEGVHIYPLGYVDHERTKVLAYSAADVFVHPAPVDNLPNVVMEAIACGTPVVGFAIGGVPDMVHPGQTGWLCNEISSRALASVVDVALGDVQDGNDLRASCRSLAEAEYAPHRQAEYYIELFRSIASK
jgi:glycosyltransferase involved in cell wall biosynthesis